MSSSEEMEGDERGEISVATEVTGKKGSKRREFPAKPRPVTLAGS